MKPLLLAAAVLLLAPATLASGAHAQAAAGALPNTFDDPAARARAVSPAPAPSPAAPASALASDPANAASDDILRTLIASAQAGAMDYALMTDGLAARVREQEATVTPLIQGFGPLVAVDFVGSRDRNDLFAVTFANAATEWVIGIDDAGKVAALLFRPAE